MAEAGPPLEGDGYVDAIYSYLWMKSQDRRSCPNILIPDTVIYKYRHIAQVTLPSTPLRLVSLPVSAPAIPPPR